MSHVRYDPLEHTCLENPYQKYRTLMEQDPHHWSEQLQSRIVSLYSDCQFVLSESQLFARDRRRVGLEVPPEQLNLQSYDPPQLRPYRSAAIRGMRAVENDLTSPGIAKGLTETVSRKLASKSAIDAMEEIAAPYALSATSAYFGVPEPNHHEYREISEKIALGMDSGLRPGQLQPSIDARQRLGKLVQTWLDERLRTRTDAFADTLRSRTDMSDAVVRNTVANAFNASYGTLYAALGNIIAWMFSDENLFDLVSSKPVTDDVVNELLRMDGPAQATSRVAVADVTLPSGGTVSKGETVVTLIAAANRDPAIFINPDSFMPSRSPNPHLAFGWGVHSCLGARLAIPALQDAIEAMLAVQPRPRVVSVVRRETATVRCPSQVWLSSDSFYDRG